MSPNSEPPTTTYIPSETAPLFSPPSALRKRNTPLPLNLTKTNSATTTTSHTPPATPTPTLLSKLDPLAQPFISSFPTPDSNPNPNTDTHSHSHSRSSSDSATQTFTPPSTTPSTPTNTTSPPKTTLSPTHTTTIPLPIPLPTKPRHLDVLVRDYPIPEKAIDVAEALAKGPPPGRFYIVPAPKEESEEEKREEFERVKREIRGWMV
ncbi:hypothetical protein VTL71DRAFT_8603 [Oculimacula yallundae]|uniref:Uncharacterized protein n=1 Tax=Oculimacula yallundae TaxID=86028 RepID=A0ABR4D0G0_9HELO